MPVLLDSSLLIDLEREVVWQTMADAIPAGPNGTAKILRHRVKVLQSWHAKSRRLMPAIRMLLQLSP